ncbi:hypothetical protein ABTM75_19275, partial [Acinetobacter baumannii]
TIQRGQSVSSFDDPGTFLECHLATGDTTGRPPLQAEVPPESRSNNKKHAPRYALERAIKQSVL